MNNKRLLLTALAGFALALPFATFAAKGLTEAATNIQNIINILTRAAYMLAFLAFFWGLATYLFSKNEEKKKSATIVMISSVVVIFIMTSIWGIVRVLQGTLGIDSNTEIELEIPTPRI